ncbi:MAG: VanZ family protein [Halovenus sp.]
MSDNRLFGVTAIATLLLVGSATPLPTRYNPDFGLCGPDKLLHLLGHASLTAALVDTFHDNSRSLQVAVIAVVLSTGYGIGTELLQEAIPGREFERGDVVAGFFGSLVAVLGYGLL